MKATDLKTKTVQQLKAELLELRREQFNRAYPEIRGG